MQGGPRDPGLLPKGRPPSPGDGPGFPEGAHGTAARLATTSRPHLPRPRPGPCFCNLSALSEKPNWELERSQLRFPNEKFKEKQR